MSEPVIHNIFEPNTCTWQYIVADPSTKVAVIIDPVLDYDPSSNRLSSDHADALLSVVNENGFKVERILETHVHADHLTAAGYLQSKLASSGNSRPVICIGKHVSQVQDTFAKRYGITKDEYQSAFGKLFEDDEHFSIGQLEAKAVHLPGHTPDHMAYMIGCRFDLSRSRTGIFTDRASCVANVFCGDSLFNPDVGSARCDFPGGDASSLYKSVQKLLSLPAHFKIWTGHDYPPGGADGRSEPQAAVTIERQKADNKHLKEGVSEEDFVKWRTTRDSTLAQPRLIHQSLQINIRAGRLPAKSAAGDRLLHLPLSTRNIEWPM